MKNRTAAAGKRPRSDTSAPPAPRPPPRKKRPGTDSLRGMEFQVGQRLRQLRAAKRLSLAELAAQADISVASLSQIERGLAVPTIRTFCLLSRALGIGAGWLLEEYGGNADPADPYIVRAGTAKTIVFSKYGVIKQLVSPAHPGELQMLVVEIEPDAGSGDKSYTHDGEECGIVLEGLLDLWIDEVKRTLGAGDSFRFESHRPHRFCNPGNVSTKVIWVISPPLY